MASLNKVILVGNLGRDPELKSTPSGSKVLEVSIATTERFTDRNNEQQEQTDWHRIVMWNQKAEYIARNTRKGSTIYVEGKLRYRKYTAQDGGERFITEILADTVTILGGRATENSQSSFVGEQPQYQKSYQSGSSKSGGTEEASSDLGEAPAVTDDLPF
jgi:single-strand DNA-binding protein